MTTEILDSVSTAWLEAYLKLNEDIFNFNMVKPLPSDWIEQTIVLPRETSAFPGNYSFQWSPYMKQIVNHVHPADSVRYITVMKCVQSGATAGLVIPGILYIMSQIPDNILFTGADVQLIKKTITERFDLVIRASRLDHLIRPNVIKRSNNRTGDTAQQKEFAGGTLTGLPTSNPNAIRFYSTKYNFNDDFDTTPQEAGKEGAAEELLEGRQVSFRGNAKTFRISTPTITQTSQIYQSYLLGTQNKWNWPCIHCGLYFPLDIKINCPDGDKAGLVWKLESVSKDLILDSVYLKCPHCRELISERDKFDINQKGEWISSIEKAIERRHESYLIPGLAGFAPWVTIAEKFLKANPPGGKPVLKYLKTFKNLYEGMPFEEMGESPRVTQLMENTCKYHPGVVPDDTCERDVNGKIIMLTLACDINGLMETGINEDIRLDWEILAHTSNGPTYSVDHGSIGTFKRTRDIKKSEEEQRENRLKWTLVEGSMGVNELGERVNNCVWKPFEEIIQKIYLGESGKEYSIHLTAIDTGHGEKYASLFIEKMQQLGLYVYGVKGRTDENGRKLQRDSLPVKRSVERPRTLYILEVDQLKDDLSQMMKLRQGDGGMQPSGFMNFPESRDGKYDLNNYFSHYEGERRKEVLAPGGGVVGFKWEKKNNQVQNHFWDVRVYNIAAPLIWVDLLKQSDPKYKNITWEEAVQLLID
jgi:phage terminase large subunit GpA-like protein